MTEAEIENETWARPGNEATVDEARRSIVTTREDIRNHVVMLTMIAELARFTDECNEALLVCSKEGTAASAQVCSLRILTASRELTLQVQDIGGGIGPLLMGLLRHSRWVGCPASFHEEAEEKMAATMAREAKH
jgi:hypothetical protein